MESLGPETLGPELGHYTLVRILTILHEECDYEIEGPGMSNFNMGVFTHHNRWKDLLTYHFTRHGQPVHHGKDLSSFFGSTPWYRNAFDDYKTITGKTLDLSIFIPPSSKLQVGKFDPP